MKRIKRIAISIVVALGFAAPAFAPAIASAADVNQNLCNGANLSFSGDDANCGTDGVDDEAGTQIDNIVTQVINILSLIVGVVSVIMIIIGGFRYVTSGGESGQVTSAKNTILYAIVGLVVVAVAQLIVRLVVSKVAETPTTT